jgi:hypothetical protein
MKRVQYMAKSGVQVSLLPTNFLHKMYIIVWLLDVAFPQMGNASMKRSESLD